MKIAWFTDIHLNCLDKKQREVFYIEIVKTKAQAILISGDIAEAASVDNILSEMDGAINLPIFFVLGNHDFYGSNVSDVYKKIKNLVASYINLSWLAEAGPNVLTDNTLLVGADGWADGRYGNYAQSHVVLNDSLMISDLFQAKLLGKQSLLAQMQLLADRDAMRLERQLKSAVKQNAKKIIVLTHVPPFAEASLYQQKIATEDYLPFFSSKAVGDVLLKYAIEYKDTDFMVLSGHSHELACYRALDNLIVKVSDAEYGRPKLAEVLDLSE